MKEITKKLISIARKYLWTIDDRLSDLKEEFAEYESLWDDYTIEDFKERIEHYESLKKEVKAVIKEAEEK